MQTQVSFPDHFVDWTCERLADPDCFFFPFVIADLKFVDSRGVVFDSTDMPLDIPDLSESDTAVGRLMLLDVDGDVDFYAIAEFRGCSLHRVPEPTALALVPCALIGFLSQKRRSTGMATPVDLRRVARRGGITSERNG